MNIHIFGHSICLQSKSDIPSFVDILVAKYNIIPNNVHIAVCGSEERILYFLKKVKDPIDIAIIFHGDPNFVFVPPLERDIQPSTGKEPFYSSKNNVYVNYFKNIPQDKSQPVVSKVHINDFVRAKDLFLKYFYTPDLNANRHYGALIQIDQYLKYKNIKAIHCVLEKTLPTWFDFTNGIVDTEITQLQTPNSLYACDHRFSLNRINKEGNEYIASKLIHYIEKWPGHQESNLDL